MCLIKVGGLELWRPNLCLNCASSSWPWELLCWTECYLFGHLIHTHKWPLGAVFDKQTDWIAWVNACGFSPSLSSRPLRTGPIYLKDVENSTCTFTLHTHALMCAYVLYTLLYTHRHKHTHTRTSKYTLTLHLLTQSQSHSIQSLLTHQDSQDWLRFQGVLWANSNHIEGNRILLFAYCPNNNPKAGTQGWRHISSIQKRRMRQKAKLLLWDL